MIWLKLKGKLMVTPYDDNCKIIRTWNLLGIEDQIRSDIQRLEQYLSEWKGEINSGAYIKSKPL